MTSSINAQHSSTHNAESFRRFIYNWYEENGRDLPWRRTSDPWCILVSEVMLQQTQVPRVVDKYTSFIRTFPDPQSLAYASTADALRQWKGLGYNRRALYLKRTAKMLMEEFGGRVPDNEKDLQSLPGIGAATAAAICVHAFNQPAVFIETNIRAVFIHHFFPNCASVNDARILRIVADTLDYENPGRWYSALMDYGTMLKKKHGNPARRSSRHQVQKPFEGSNRQIRGRILEELLRGSVMLSVLQETLSADQERLEKIIDDLAREGFIKRDGKIICLA
jgi:A/G-specific adenine glycosylase